MLKAILFIGINFTIVLGLKSQERKYHLDIRTDLIYSSFLDDDYYNNTTHGFSYRFSLLNTINAWKESTASLGVGYNVIPESESTRRYEVICFPLRLQKFFNPSRNKFNLAFSIIPGYIPAKTKQRIKFFLCYEMGYKTTLFNRGLNLGLAVENDTDSIQNQRLIQAGCFIHYSLF